MNKKLRRAIHTLTATVHTLTEAVDALTATIKPPGKPKPQVVDWGEPIERTRPDGTVVKLSRAAAFVEGLDEVRGRVLAGHTFGRNKP